MHSLGCDCRDRNSVVWLVFPSRLRSLDLLGRLCCLVRRELSVATQRYKYAARRPSKLICNLVEAPTLQARKDIDFNPAMAAQSILDLVPPELIMNIASHVQVEDVLSFKLTSKALNAYLPTLSTFRTIESSRYYNHKRTVIEAQRRLECSMHRDFPTRHLQNLLCTECGRVSPRSGSADNQRKRLRTGYETSRLMKRRCLHCLRKDKKTRFLKKANDFSLDGVPSYICDVCNDIKPVTQAGTLETLPLSVLYRSNLAVKSGIPLHNVYYSVKAGQRRACKMCIEDELIPLVAEDKQMAINGARSPAL